MTAVAEPVLQPARSARWVTPVTIGLMLFLRIVVLGAGAWIIKPIPAWLEPLYETSTYLLTLFLIFWERERLEEFHIGWLAVGIILIFKPLETLYQAAMNVGQKPPLAFPGLPALLVWAGALGMLVWLIAARPGLRRVTAGEKRWFGLGILAGLVCVTLLAVPMALQLKLMGGPGAGGPPSVMDLLFATLLMDFPYQLGYAAVSEEPLFRGFLWGWLRQQGWRDAWIWLFQAGLFMLSHIYYIGRLPYSFWIIVPVGALVMGWIAWRSRSIAASMAAHATLNALGMRVGMIVFSWLFR